MALISFEDDSWVGEHDSCERLHRNIQTQLITWSGETRSSPFYAQLSAEIRLRLKQYREEVAQLDELLKKTKREQVITDAEYERRFRQIETLRSKYTHLQNQFNAGIHKPALKTELDSSAERKELFGNTSGVSKPKKYGEVRTVNWGVDSDDDELLDDKPSIQKIQLKQDEIMQEQDKCLEDLSKIIIQQKNIAENIGNELCLQNGIIDDLTSHIERTNEQVHSETGQIRVIGVKDNTCWYWTIIILLFIAIIVIGCL